METMKNGPAGMAVRRILIVDDDDVDRFILKRNILAAMPAKEITEANSGETALNMLLEKTAQKNPVPELIFLDLNMTPMSGLEFLDLFEKMSTEHPNNCSIMIITAKPDEDEKQQLMNHQKVIGYHAKPVTAELLMKINEQLNDKMKISNGRVE